jgi:putative alpha-1,2-mannosidase
LVQRQNALLGVQNNRKGAAHRQASARCIVYPAASRFKSANFTGWDVYRSQVQLIILIGPKVGSDFAQSLFSQADQ